MKTHPPLAEIKAHRLEKDGDVRIDPYFWLKQREDEKVIAYLRAENAHTEAAMKPTEELREKLFSEMKGRIKEESSSAPEKDGDFFYYRRFEKGKEYPIYCRKREGVQEEVILDSNELAKGHSYFSLGALSPSDDHRILAYAVDYIGRRIHTLYFKDLNTGRLLDDRIDEVTGNLAWASDNKTLFYSKQNLETLRSDRVFRYKLGGSKSEQVFEESDETFSAHVYRTSSKKFLVIASDSTMTSEARYVSASHPEGYFQVFQPRERGHEYSIDDAGDRFVIRTNHGARNFKLMQAPFDQHAMSNWKEWIPHREDTLLEGFQPFKNYLALQERKEGLSQIQIIDRKSSKGSYLQFDDPVYLASIGSNREFDTEQLRFGYESLSRPDSHYDFNMRTKERVLRERREVIGFSSENYESRRLFAEAPDGVRIPISLVTRKDTPKGADTPCMIYGYGSYGLSMDPYFRSVWLSLLDRGFVIAIAHVRGGSEMGRKWYEDGRQLKKKNTFTDFIACSEYLIKEGWTSPSHLHAMGGSAGGLLMGAVMNARPDLYRGVVAQVPFVDVLTTMLDDTIPLTTGEYDEWGNPNEKAYYDYIKTYSPYDNVRAQAYPNTLITTGLHDSQVQYWEPAKWAAKLRTVQKGEAQILLWTEMDAGHGGKSGRFDRLIEQARVYSFFLGLEGKFD